MFDCPNAIIDRTLKHRLFNRVRHLLAQAFLRFLPDALLMVGAIVLVVAFTWPWCLHWGTHFLDHIDPPFHAWKLEFMARRILAGDILLSSGNTNMLYPNSGALYFEALQYPASLAAAPLLAFGMRPEIAYHVVLVFFWALAAPCIRFLLRELGCNTLSSTAGALVFTVLPLRTRYMVALQLELVFALPLFYAFIIRFFRRPNATDAILAALSWWLLAISELNEAFFAGLLVPLIVLAFFSARPGILASRKFWVSALTGMAAGGISLCCLLLPYLEQHGEGAVNRSLREIAKNSGQPFAYLLPWGRFRLWNLPEACPDELSVYPTVVLLILAAAACILWWRSSFVHAASSRNVSGIAPVRERLARTVHVAVPLSCILYAAILLPCQLRICAWNKTFDATWQVVSWCTAAGALALVFLPAQGESPRTSFLRGFASIAVFSCILSFGPYLRMGDPGHYLLSRSNPVFETLSRAFPPLSSFRTVSRFGILVVFFVFCTAVCALDTAIRRAKSSRSVQKWLPSVLTAAIVVLCAIECIPPKGWNSSFREIDHPRESPAMARLFENHPIRTLVGFPMRERSMEGMRMFSLLKGDYPYVYAWGGYFPVYSEDICNSYIKLLRGRFHNHVASMYPSGLVFVDHAWQSAKNCNPNGAPEDSVRLLPDGSRAFDIELWLSFIAERVDGDSRYSLWEPIPLPPAPVAMRRFRTDVALMNPVLTADVLAKPGEEVEMSLNGNPLHASVADASGIAAFRFDLDSVARRLWSRSAPNEIAFKVGNGPSGQDRSGRLVRLDRFTMLGRDGSYHDPCAPYTVSAHPPPPDEPYRPDREKSGTDRL